MPRNRLIVLALVTMTGIAFLAPARASAQEIGFVLGRFVGDDLLERAPVIGPLGSVSITDATVYGGRITFGAVLFALEGSVIYTPTSVTLGVGGTTLSAKFLYGDASVVLQILPGPISPFVAAGIGLHRISWGENGIDSYTTVGYNAGVGIRVGLGGLGVRADLRDHITPIKLADLDPNLVNLLGLQGDVMLHNFELSATLLLRF